MSTKPIRCWHFAAETLRDGRPLPKAGNILYHRDVIEPCRSGLHGSVRAIDALRYAPGPFVAVVELSGMIVAHGAPVDKHVASERRNVTGYVDVSDTLHRFSCWCATKALDRIEKNGGTVDPRSRAAIAAKLMWLRGEIDGATLAAARDAARDVARAAAAALHTAAWAAARAAARAAAWAAARDVARAAAWAAARAAQNVELERLLAEALKIEMDNL